VLADTHPVPQPLPAFPSMPTLTQQTDWNICEMCLVTLPLTEVA
jgi:hypothetical protein